MSTKDAVATMGGLLPDEAGGRDAVHVAVVSAVSDVRLRPNQDVGVEITSGRDVKARPTSSTTEGVGKVDPYLSAIVEPGQRFWVYLYPRSITGLNHNWSHPAFPDAKPGEVYISPAGKLVSEQWLRSFADQVYADYDEMMIGAKDGLAHGYINFNTSSGGEIPSEFWVHYERVTGERVSDAPDYFSCSC